MGETSSDGSFTVQAPAGEDSLLFEDSGNLPGLPREFSGRVNVTAEQNTQVDIVLPPTVAITATVKDTRGNPVEGATIFPNPKEFRTAAYAPFPGASTTVEFAPTIATTDAAGEATIYSFAIAELGLEAQIGSGGLTRRDHQSVAATSDTSVSFTLPEPPEPVIVTVSGVLRTAEGQPVPNAFIQLEGLGGSGVGETSSDGSFTVQAPAGEDSLLFEDSGNLPGLPREFSGRVNVTAEQNTALDIVLPPTVAITATVKDTRGNPVEGATIFPNPKEFRTAAYAPFPGASTTVEFAPTIATTDAAGEATIYSFAIAELAS